MRDIYVGVIFLRVKIYWMFFYWSHFFDVHFSFCEVFMRQVFPDTIYLYFSFLFPITMSTCDPCSRHILTQINVNFDNQV